MSWRAIQACVRGRSHESDGSGCDDRAATLKVGGLVAVALADGCGSALLGGLGARIAVRAALDAVGRAPDANLQKLASVALEAAWRAVQTLALEMERPPRDCASTLMLAIAREAQVAIAHVGDGVVVGRVAGRWVVLSAPMGGEHANETLVLSDAAALEHARVELFDDVTSCALLTDGAATSLWERATGRVAPAVEKVARAVDERALDDAQALLRDQLCASLRTRTLDDCGVAIVVRAGSFRVEDDPVHATPARRVRESSRPARCTSREARSQRRTPGTTRAS